MVETFSLHMLRHVKSWRSWGYWTTWMIAWHIFEDVVLVWYSLLERLYWSCKESEDLVNIMLQPLDDSWRHNYFVLSICILGKHSNISERSWTLSFFSQEDQIWLKYRRWYWIRRFPETQSRIYASLCTKNRVCLIADISLFGVSSLQHSCSAVWYLWYCLVSMVVFQFS